MIEQGWRPDKLRPSAGGDVKDAGKAYIWDGAHQQPEVVRLGRLTLVDCKQRARARASVTLSKGPKSQPTHPAAQQLLAVLDEADLDKISLGWLEKFVTVGDYEMGYDRLRRELDALGITPRRVNKGPWAEANPRGYFRSDIG